MLHKVPQIPKLLHKNQKKEGKDIIFALDFSSSMEYHSKKNHSIKALLKIFDNYMKSDDRIGFMTFNENVKVIFEL